MADVNLKDPFVTGSPAESKLKQYEKAFGGLKNSVLTQDKQICNKQTSKLKEFIRQINQTKSKVHASKGQCQTKTIKLKQEIDFLERKLQGFQIGARTLQLEAKIKSKIAQQEKAYINNCQKRVQIAESIYYQKFKKLEIDQRKSQANEVFRWILVAVYVEPENKFYWPNFLEQIFENKQGCLDLKQRLGKFNAYNAKQQQRVKTRSFIDAYEKIKLSPEFAPHNIGAEVQKIYQIAKIFLNCSDIGKQIKEYEKQIQKGRQVNSKEDETLVQSRKECDALIEKYRLSELYLDQLTKIELSLTNKIQLYNREVELAETYLAELTNITDSKIMVSHESQKREHCECSIF